MTKDTLEISNQSQPDTDELLVLGSMRMPFGKYQGPLLTDLPEPYVVWLAQNGFPEGQLGRMLQAVYEIKANGLEYLFTHPITCSNIRTKSAGKI